MQSPVKKVVKVVKKKKNKKFLFAPMKHAFFIYVSLWRRKKIRVSTWTSAFYFYGTSYRDVLLTSQSCKSGLFLSHHEIKYVKWKSLLFLKSCFSARDAATFYSCCTATVRQHGAKQPSFGRRRCEHAHRISLISGLQLLGWPCTNSCYFFHYSILYSMSKVITGYLV